MIQAKYVPVDMEYFPADPRSPVDVCRAEVLDAEIFVAIVGFRYGSPVRGQAGLSHTELEFQIAVEASKPMLVFLIDDKDERVRGLLGSKRDAKQMAFRQRLLDSEVTAVTVSNPDQLARALVAGVGGGSRRILARLRQS